MITFGQVIYLYGIIIVEFLFEYSVFAALFLHKLRRRKKFVLRVALGIPAIFAVGLPVAWFYAYFGNMFWGRMAVYFFLFGAFVALAKLCFDEKISVVFFYCSLAYAAQNLVYKLYLIIWTAGEQLRLYDGWGDNFDLFYRLVYYSIFIALTTAVWFLFIKPLVSKLQNKKLSKRMFFITVFILFVTVILCSIEDIWFAKICVERENRFDKFEYYILRQTGNVFSVVYCIIVFLLASKSIAENALLQEVEYLKYTVRQGERQYRMSKDTIELINIKCHDIKYKLNALIAQGGTNEESIKELRDNISIYDSKIDTGNQLLNVLITDKSLYCDRNGINLSCMIDGDKLGFMEDDDLYCLFGNLLDNALEAVNGVEDKGKRAINISVKEKNGAVLIQEENYFSGKREFENGLPKTTKDDKSSHGFGMRSIGMIVAKYGGEFSVSVTDDIFHLNIIFISGNVNMRNKIAI